MARIRQFYSKQTVCEGKVRLEEEEARHIHVLKLKPGDQIEVFDDKGNYGLGTIEKVSKNSVDLLIGTIEKVRRSPVLRVLASAAPKNKRFDVLLQKATELGVDKFFPIITTRSIVKPRDAKIERLKKIAIEAVKQCKRKSIPEIRSTIPVEKLIKNSDEYDVKLIADENGKKIKEVLRGVKGKKIICLIGPEGGFTDEEIEFAVKNGFKVVSLSENILRVETAGIAVLSTINYEYEL